jgi:dihydrodipicolinate synthase/N-acetylneuraminate lyase
MPRYPQTVLISCEVPWDGQMQLQEVTFRNEIQHVLKSFNHLYIFGTAGEGYAVDSAQFERIVRIFYEETRAPDVHPMVGIIGLSTPIVVERISVAYAIGFRVFQISLPSWGTVTDGEMMTFFKDVCNRFADCQFLHYNLPRTGRVLSGKEYKPLIDAIPNLVATKTTSGGLPGAADLMFHAAELQHFMGEVNFPHGCMFGECSLLASSGPMAPRQTWEFFEAGRTRNIEQLFRWQHDFYHMKQDVMGPARAHAHMDGAFDKLIKRLGGFEEMPLRLLSPYQGLSEEVFQACKQIYQTKYPDWAPAKAIS